MVAHSQLSQVRAHGPYGVQVPHVTEAVQVRVRHVDVQSLQPEIEVITLSLIIV